MTHMGQIGGPVRIVAGNGDEVRHVVSGRVWFRVDGLGNANSASATRDRVISAIYETVIRPELYDAFMSAWQAHIAAALEGMDGTGADPAQADALGLDPDLKAHFARAHEILEQIGRGLPRTSLSEQVGASGGFAVLQSLDGTTLALSARARKALGETEASGALARHLTAGAVPLLQSLRDQARVSPEEASPVVLSTGGRPRHLLARVVKDREGGPATILIEALEYHWSDRAEAMLVQSFGLSRAELDVVRNLLAGHSLRDIARLSGRSEHTVRNQAKAVLAKTGAPGQVDLIRLVVFLINRYREPPPGQDGALPCEVLTMRSGHRVQVFTAGAEQGRPMIFLHGMLDGMGPLRLLDDDMRRCNFRVIAPVRPGYGESDPLPDGANALEHCADQVCELIESHGIERPVILGHLAGAIHGHALLDRLQERVAGMVAVSCGAPVRGAGDLSAMAPRQRVVAYTARYVPMLLPPILRAGIAQIDSKGVGDFMDALYAPGTHDHAVIQKLGLAGLIQSEYRFSVQQGHAGFAMDSHLVVDDWARHVPRAGPVIHLNGALDPVVSPDRVEDFVRTRRGARLRIIPDAGQLLMYEHPVEVCRAVEELLSPGRRV